MMEKLYELKSGNSRAITAENPTGKKGAAAMEEKDIVFASSRLGKGWKCRPCIDIPAGTTAVICDIAGMGEIQSIWFGGEVDQGLIVRMYWDYSEIPAVECPITEFCCYGWSKPNEMKDDHWNRGPKYTVDSALMSVGPNRGLSCFIPMPYRKNAKITIENRTVNTKCFYYQINYEEKEISPLAGYFHAQFRISTPVPYMGVHTILDNVNGQGTYIGTALFVGLNRASRWWGEGEFKFYLDGDKEYPTICSTGLEDYFLGSFNWDCQSEYQTYSHLYSGVPGILKPDGLYEIQQRFSMYRWHVPDPVRFQENLKVTVQSLGWIQNDEGKNTYYLPREDDYISVAYFYLDKPEGCPCELPSHAYLTERF